jgi:hypothetical protein
MKEKIEETKIAILERIEKAVKDENTKISPENLVSLAGIVYSFHNLELCEKRNEIDDKLAEKDRVYYNAINDTLKSIKEKPENNSANSETPTETI